MNRTIIEKVRCLLFDAKMTKGFWSEALFAAVDIINMLPNRSIENKSPNELWFGKKCDVSVFRVFGAKAMVMIPHQKRKKLDKKSKLCIFLRRADDAKAYRFYDKESKKIIISRDAAFFENDQHDVNIEKNNINYVHTFEEIVEEEDASVEGEQAVVSGGENVNSETTTELNVNENASTSNELLTNASTSNDLHTNMTNEQPAAVNDTNASENELVSNENPTAVNAENEHPAAVNAENSTANESVITVDSSFESSNDTYEEADDTQADPTFTTKATVQEFDRPRTRSTHPFSMLNLHVAFMSLVDEPKTFKQAIECNEKDKWIAAMKDEYTALVNNDTWRLVQRPLNRNVIDNRWVYKIKRNTDGSIDRYKARLVARGFSQEYGFDYMETFSPVVRFTSIRTILAIAAHRKMVLQQFDVKTAFLNGDLSEEIFMEQPAGFTDGTDKVCRLQRSLYGLKQASRCWNQKFKNFIKLFGFITCEADPCVFVSNKNDELIILAIHVDDGLIASDSKQCIERVMFFLQKHFEIKSMSVGVFLGLEIDRRKDGSIHVHQSSYVRKVLKRFNMENCNPVATPSDSNQVLHGFTESKASNYPYREAVGSLMYLSVGTRPDITHVVGIASRYLENPTTVHENHVKGIFKYLKGTINYGLLYFNSKKLRLTGYSDADHAGDIETRRSTTGYVFFLGDGTISWSSERQKSVSISTMEAEYMAASEATKELVWLKRLLNELIPEKLDKPMFLLDNLSAIRLVKNPEFHKRSKHIDTRYHFIREKFKDDVFSLEHITTKEMRADIFTKAMPKQRFQYLRFLLGITDN